MPTLTPPPHDTPMPESVEEILKEFHDHPRINIILEIIGCQKHGADKERYIELWDELWNDDEHELESFLRKALTTAYTQGRASVSKEIQSLKKEYQDHHCCRWGESSEEHPVGKRGGYCGYELDHGFDMDEFISDLDELLGKIGEIL